MNETALVAVISASGALIVGLTSIGLNVFWMGKTFDQLRTGISDLRSDMHKRFNAIDSRLNRLGTRVDHL